MFIIYGDHQTSSKQRTWIRKINEVRWEWWGKPLWCKLLTWQLAFVSEFILYHTKTYFVHYSQLPEVHMVAKRITESCSLYRYTQDKVGDGPSYRPLSSIICGRLWPAPGVHVGSSQAVRSPVVHAGSAPDSLLSHSTGGWKPCELQ